MYQWNYGGWWLWRYDNPQPRWHFVAMHVVAFSLIAWPIWPALALGAIVVIYQ